MAKIPDEWIIDNEILVVEDKAKMKCLAVDQQAKDEKDGTSQEIISHSIMRLDEEIICVRNIRGFFTKSPQGFMIDLFICQCFYKTDIS